MFHRRGFAPWAACVFLLCVLATPHAQAAATEPQTPTSAPAGSAVPKDTIEAIEAQFSPAKQPSSREEATAMLVEQMEQAISLGKAAESWYTDAPNLYVVRKLMLSAALELLARQPTEERQQQVVDIARRIMGSPAPTPEKLQADFFLLREEIRLALRPPGAPEGSEAVAALTPEEVKRLAEVHRAEIAEFLKRYQATSALARSVAYGVVLAELAKLPDLTTALLDRLENQFGHLEELTPFLRHYGRGRFTAHLKRLDGSELVVPDGVKAPVIVIDFWATWCGPCVAEAPRMKRIYEQFHPRGVEFVGVSLDEDPGAADKVKRFIERYGLNWIHTLSGRGWEDPTARAYGVDGIPAVWVIDGSGKILSNDAQANLEQVLEDALHRPPTTAPAGASTTQPAP